MLLRQIIIFFLVVLAHGSIGQNLYDSAFFKPIVQHVEQIKLERNSIENLSHQLTHPYKTKKEKIAAIYTWVAKNIKYDIKRINTFRTYKTDSEVLDYVVKTNRGLCLHYCIYFNELCKYANIESRTISGYVKQRGKIKQTPHTWNAIQLNKSWYLFDITWAAGYVSNNTFYERFSNDYFMLSPKQFIKSHMPFDKLWQLVYYPKTFDDFANGERISDSIYFNYTDTLQTYLAANECEQLIQENRRIENNGSIFPVVSNELYYKKQNIKICLHNMQADLINNGVAQYEKAVEKFNTYINLYNGRFNSPKVSDDELTLLMENLSLNINKAKSTYLKVLRMNSEINEAVQVNLQSLNELEVQVNKERAFITKYLHTPPSRRMQLFIDRKFM